GHALGAERDLGAALGEAGGPALAFEGDGVGLRRLDVGEGELALELGADRADARHHQHLILVVAGRRDRLAARDAGLEDLGIIEPVPHRLLRGGNQLLAAYLHARFSWLFRVRGPFKVRPRSTRLFRLCTGRKRSTCGSMARTPAGRASNLS